MILYKLAIEEHVLLAEWIQISNARFWHLLWSTKLFHLHEFIGSSHTILWWQLGE